MYRSCEEKVIHMPLWATDELSTKSTGYPQLFTGLTPKPTKVGCGLFAKAGPDGHRKGGWLLPSAQVPNIQLPGASATFLVSVLIQFVIFIEPGGGNFHQLGLKCLVFHRDELFQLFTVLVGDRVHLHHIAGDAFSFVSIIVGGALFIGLRVAVFFNGIGKDCVFFTIVEEVPG